MKCAKKVAYASEAAASKWGWAWHQRAYLCPSCRKYHLTKARQGPGDEAREQRAVEAAHAADVMKHDFKYMTRRTNADKGRKRRK